MSSITVKVIRDVRAEAVLVESFIEKMLMENDTQVSLGNGNELPSSGPLSTGLSNLLQVSVEQAYWAALFQSEGKVVGLMLDFFNFGDYVHVPYWTLPTEVVPLDVVHRAAELLAANHCAEVGELVRSRRCVRFCGNLNVSASDARFFFPLIGVDPGSVLPA